MSGVSKIHIDQEAITLFSIEQAWHYKIVPSSVNGQKACMYTDSSGENSIVKDELEIILGREITFIPIEKAELQVLLRKYYPKTTRDVQQYRGGDDFLELIIKEAKTNESSDIHFEAYEDICRVRIRIDGRLTERYRIPVEDYKVIINKIKIQSNLDIAEKRLPQDGRILFSGSGTEFDIRVSILPTLWGEKAVLRLLQKETTQLELNSLGMNLSQLEKYREGISKAHGIVLISGPTGSGKTTTLYGTLKEINSIDKNILTIEDPIEYTLEGINQVQLKESIGLTFASALRTFLRQDPDIIMLGEIRDPETAQMACRASLTGHLVFSTIHTNSAIGIITRLQDMGIPGYIIASTLCLAVAQRLVRLLCPECKKEHKPEKSELPKAFRDMDMSETIYEAVGCDLCHQTGYRGRKAIYEVLSIDDYLAEKIRKGNLDLTELKEDKKIKTLSDSALEIMNSGLSSLSEIYPILISNVN